MKPAPARPDGKKYPTARLLAAGLTCSLLVAGDARAQVYAWDGSVDSQWIDDFNWSPVGSPGAASTTIFGTASNYTVDMGGTLRAVLAADIVSGQDYTFTNGDLYALNTRIATTPSAWVNLNSTSSFVANTSFNLGISESGSTLGGNLNTNGGSLYVGNAANTGAANSIIISDSTSGAVLLNVRRQSQLTHSGTTILGDAAGSNGRIFVSEASSFEAGSNFYVGFNGDGKVDLLNGSQISNGNGFIARQAGSTGFFAVAGSSTWTNRGILLVGDIGTGTLRVVSGADVSNTTGYIGFSGTGTATVKDAGSTWTNTDDLNLGFVGSATGTLNIESGGRVFVGDTAAASTLTSTLVVSDGNNAPPNGVGGRLTIARGSTLNNSGVASLGGGTGEHGYVTVNGSGSLLNNTGVLYVGHLGNGTLRVEAGGHIMSPIGIIALTAGVGGTATVTGVGSTWTNTGELLVGDSGNGTLNVQAGGEVSNTDGFIGTGTATVKDAGSTWTNTDDLYLGFGSATGTLNIESGGRVFVGDTAAASTLTSTLVVSDGNNAPPTGDGGRLTIAIGSTLNNSGVASLGGGTGEHGYVTVTGNGSLLNNTGALYVGQLGAGTLRVEAGGDINSGNGYIGRLEGVGGTATVTGDGSTWTNNGFLIVGDRGVGSLDIGSGGTVTNINGFIGWAGTGVVTVAGIGSIWNNTQNLQLGVESSGKGTLNINPGGSVYVGDTAARASESFPLTISDGNSGTPGGVGGDLQVRRGSIINNYAGASLGSGPGELGTATVDGAGSQWINSGDLFVGHYGNANLDIKNGGVLSNRSGYIGNESTASGTVTVDGTGSAWTNTEDLILSGGLTFDGGAASLTISNGGSVHVGDAAKAGANLYDLNISDSDNTDGFGVGGQLSVRNGSTLTHVGDALLGDDFGEYGYATVTGTDSTWTNTGSLFVGTSGTGTLIVQAGGKVSTSVSSIGNNSGSTGTATVTGVGSNLTNTGELYVGASGTGTLNVLNNGRVQVGSILSLNNASSAVNLNGGVIDASTIVINDGTFNFTDGTLIVNAFNGNLTQQGGTLAPGNSPGTTTITGDYNLNAGAIAIEIGGLDPGTQYDLITVDGTLNLGGVGGATTLDVTLIDGFSPTVGDTFDILDFASLTGVFDAVNLDTLGPGLLWDDTGLYTDGTITVVALLPADLSGDGDVDDEDLGLFFSAFTGPDNGPSANPAADLSGDGDVDDEDLGLAFSQFTGPLAPINVPEPTSLALLGCGGWALLRRLR